MCFVGSAVVECLTPDRGAADSSIIDQSNLIDNQMVELKEFFEKVDFEKKSANDGKELRTK